MKKTFKRAGVAVLSMAMLLSMGAVGAMTASAANGTVTVASSTNLKADDTVTFYKVAGTNSTTGDWKWVNGLSDASVGTAMSTVKGYNESTNAAELKALASKIKRLVDAGGTSYTGSAEASTAKVNGASASLAPGYYLGIVTSTDNSMTVAPILVAVTDGGSSTVSQVKSSTVEIDKEVKEVTDGVTAADHESADVSKDSVITYTIAADIPEYDSQVSSLTTHYTITDTASNLTLGAISSVVVDMDDDGDLTDTEGGTPGAIVLAKDSATAALKYTMPEAGTGNLFKVQLDDAATLAYGGHKVWVTFTASLTNGAYNVMSEANPNTATLTYANDYATGGGSKSIDDTVNVYTALLKLSKLISGDTTTSRAFTFTLQKHNGTEYVDYRTNISVTSNGSAVELSGLPTGQYKIIESDVANYKPFSPLTFEITDTNNNGRFDLASGASASVTAVDNEAAAADGTVGKGINDYFNAVATNAKIDALPGTGGMGTTLFTIGGAAIVLLAGAMFVVYMRRRKNEE